MTVTTRRLPQPRDVLQVLSRAGDLHVDLQPVVHLESGAVWGVEALARFPGHPRPGPAAWFAAALGVGHGPALETVALAGALELLDRLPAPLTLSVNLSPTALLRAEVAELLLQAERGRLLVEITEHEAVADYDALVAALAPLRDGGVRVGIDDFGAGHATLQHVLQVSPDVVKLDISLTRHVDVEPERRRVVADMVELCAGLGAALVAEGVEAPGELAALLDLGVGYAQGWHIGRPAAPDVLLPLLQAVPETPAVPVLDLPSV